MPDQNLPIPDFADDGMLLAVEAPTASRATITLTTITKISIWASPLAL
jgi:hypothetical protein